MYYVIWNSAGVNKDFSPRILGGGGGGKFLAHFDVFVTNVRYQLWREKILGSLPLGTITITIEAVFAAVLVGNVWLGSPVTVVKIAMTTSFGGQMLSCQVTAKAYVLSSALDLPLLGVVFAPFCLLAYLKCPISEYQIYWFLKYKNKLKAEHRQAHWSSVETVSSEALEEVCTLQIRSCNTS